MCESHTSYVHNRESLSKHKPITTNRWHAIVSSCKILWVNWLYSVIPKTYLWLITISHVKYALLNQICDISSLLPQHRSHDATSQFPSTVSLLIEVPPLGSCWWFPHCAIAISLYSGQWFRYRLQHVVARSCPSVLWWCRPKVKWSLSRCLFPVVVRQLSL